MPVKSSLRSPHAHSVKRLSNFWRCGNSQPQVMFLRLAVRSSQFSGIDHLSPEQCGQRSLEGLTELGHRDGEVSLDLDGVAALVDDPDTRPRQAASGAHTGEAGLLGARHCHEDPSGRFREQGHERIGTLGNQDAATGFAGQRSFDHSLGQSTLGEVVSCGDQSVTRRGEQDVRKQLLTSEVDLRRHATEMTVLDLRPDGTVELVVGIAEQDQRLAGFSPRPVGIRR